jgi:dTDP-4-amino-4,6-dideoxygalactose transaminase
VKPLKTRWEDLAIAGGVPAFEQALHVGRPNIGDRQVFMERMNSILDRRWLTNNGTYLQQFEQAVAERAGVRHCVAVCNATVALQLAARALGLTGEVIVPAFTFVATAHAMQWEGLTPVFCDVDPATMQMTPDAAEKLITERTSAMVPVHLWGRVADVVGFEQVAERHGLSLLFDAAHAFGCGLGDRPVGSFGDAEVFSFHATKFINSFEGGAVVTNDDVLADKLRRLRNFGFEDYDLVADLGTNGKMTEPSAAMGLTSIESMEEFVACNRTNLALYKAGLQGLPGVRLLDPTGPQRSNYQYIVLQIAPDAPVSRDVLCSVLHAENVHARRYFHPGVHRMEPYRSSPLYADLHLPNTERLADEVLCLPTGTAVAEPEIATICAIIKAALGRGEASGRSTRDR